MTISLKSIETVKVLIKVVVGLTFLHALGVFSTFYLHHSHVFGLVKLFDFDIEANVPNLFSSLILLFSAALFAIIAAYKKRENASYASHWIGLGVIFLFLFLDESVSIHELLGKVTKRYIETSGVFYFAWIIPYGIILLFFLLTYLKFLFHLPKRIRLLLILSGSIFVMGCVGMEIPGGYVAELAGRENLTYVLCTTIEELLEMLGIVLLIYTLISYIESEYNELRIDISLLKKPVMSN